jgi:hypothetical protein
LPAEPAQYALLKSIMNAIPLRQVDEIERFAVALEVSGKAASLDRQNIQDARNSPKQPR